MCQCRFIRCCQHITLVGNAGNWWMWSMGTWVRANLCTCPSKDKEEERKKKAEKNLWSSGNILVNFIYPKHGMLQNRKWRQVFLSYRPRLYINKVSPHWPLREFPRFIHHLIDVQAGFRKGRGTRDQIANIYWIIEKAREFQKNIYFCFIDYAKAFDCVDHNKLENSERDWNARPPDLPLEKFVCRSGSNS